eukprot:COSAG05_NODE_124_length_17559_cov_8.898643_13_plen_220_part_00
MAEQAPTAKEEELDLPLLSFLACFVGAVVCGAALVARKRERTRREAKEALEPAAWGVRADRPVTEGVLPQSVRRVVQTGTPDDLFQLSLQRPTSSRQPTSQTPDGFSLAGLDDDSEASELLEFRAQLEAEEAAAKQAERLEKGVGLRLNRMQASLRQSLGRAYHLKPPDVKKREKLQKAARSPLELHLGLTRAPANAQAFEQFHSALDQAEVAALILPI